MNASGDVNDVVFPCGWVQVGDELRIYYGAADTSVSVASAKMKDIKDRKAGCEGSKGSIRVSEKRRHNTKNLLKMSLR